MTTPETKPACEQCGDPECRMSKRPVDQRNGCCGYDVGIPEFADTCCGSCAPGRCYVDQMTGA